MSDFDRRRQLLLKEKSATGGDGWIGEVQKYLNTLEDNVSSDTNIVQWWQVCALLLFDSLSPK